MMRPFLTCLLLLFPLPGWAGDESPLPADTRVPEATLPTPEAGGSLLDIAANFTGAEVLEKLQKALKEGQSPQVADSAGNTPLLYLCEALELDYRYRTEPHYAQALEAAISLLLQHGADALHENKAGCNAVFYLQSKPLLLKKLREEKLLPKDLAVRIPYEPAALGRYMRLRVRQAECTTHAECLQYLAQRYCTPAYGRAFDLLQRYLKAESARRIPRQALPETLAFLRLADAARAEEYINSLPLWEHGEHFLEDVPGQLLSTLAQLEWKVRPEQLKKALEKLDSMLPRSPDEMIDCHAALPMGQILEMLFQQEGDKALPLVRHYTGSRDPELAFRAYALLLQREGLPLPEPAALAAVFGLAEGDKGGELPPLPRRLYECALVDEALRLDDFSRTDAAMLQRVELAWRDMGLAAQADLLPALLEKGEETEGEETPRLTEDAYARHAAHTAYMELPAPSPRIILARYILEHPDMFQPAQPPDAP